MPFFVFQMRVWALSWTKTKCRFLPYRMVTAKSLSLSQPASRAIRSFCHQWDADAVSLPSAFYTLPGFSPLLIPHFWETLFREKKNRTKRISLETCKTWSFFVCFHFYQEEKLDWIPGNSLRHSLNRRTNAQSKPGFLLHHSRGSVNKNTPTTKVNMAPKQAPELLPQSEKKHGNFH